MIYIIESTVEDATKPHTISLKLAYLLKNTNTEKYPKVSKFNNYTIRINFVSEFVLY